MSNLELNHVYKVYPNGVKAVNDFTMEIKDKEFIVFVGPSGCGKSTTLRMIAGLEEITAGDIKIDNLIVNDAEPKERDIAMVFQNYALYPHMTVYKNMAFGLKLRHMPSAEIDQRVRAAAEILGITDYLDRKPKAMSGGQRQRVALGRAIVREPKVFLLDEPLSNLDAKLRATMRSEISKLHHKLQTTFIYVTHDQVEAMTMGDRIVVMKDGFVQQIDTPQNLYRFPNNKFVAGFIGTPQMNFFKGSLLRKDEDTVTVTFEGVDISFDVPNDLFASVDPVYLNGDKKIYIGIRSEHVSNDSNKYPYKAKCKVSHVEELGVESQIYADLNLTNEDIVNDSSETKILLRAATGTRYQADSVIEISFDLNNVHLFDVETEENINPRMPKVVKAKAEYDGKKLVLFSNKFDVPPAIKLEEGTYDVEIPAEAITKGSNVKGTINKINKTSEKNSYVLKIGKQYLFASEDLNDETKVGDSFQVDIDLKQCKFVGQNVVEPLKNDNSLMANVSFETVKIDHVNAKGKKKLIKEMYCKLRTLNTEFVVGKEIGSKLANLKENKVIRDTVEIRFTPFDATLKDEGIAGEVTSVIDYGDTQFANVMLADGNEVVIQCAKDQPLGPTHIDLNVNAIHAYDIKNNLRLL